MKDEFMKFLNALMDANPELTKKLMNDDVQRYIDALGIAEAKDKPTFTENGKRVFDYLREHSEVENWKSKDIADGLLLASRTVSGALRKLVDDGFVEKIGKDPIIYVLSKKGKEFNNEEN